MSRATGLVRFPNGNIVVCCYCGISDYMYSKLITADELDSKFDGAVFEWNSAVKEDDYNTKSEKRNLGEQDAVDVDIYSDYGGGFWWKGKASESQMVITDGHCLEYVDIVYRERPKWAQEFLDKWIGGHWV